MDGDRSTTPPSPPPESSETAQPPQQNSQLQSQPGNVQPATQEGRAEQMDIESHETRMDLDYSQSRLPRPATSKTSEAPRPIHINTDHQTNGNSQSASFAHGPHLAPDRAATPSTPGSLTPFGWDDLESRFEKALANANKHEEELTAEFEALVKYFQIWASTASAHDNERAAKRLQTRTQFVRLREVDLESRRQNYEQVVNAFQSAMSLLNQAQR